MRTTTASSTERPVRLPHDRMRRRPRLDVLVRPLPRRRPGRAVLAL